MRRVGVWAIAAAIVLSAPAAAMAADEQQNRSAVARGCEELFKSTKVVYRGLTPTMTLQDLVSYAAPVFWLSPDEPTLHRQRGKDMRVPAAFPFESQPDSPVIYYQVTDLSELPHSATPGIQLDRADKGQSIVRLDSVSALRVKYIAYFPEEAGVGQHLHDVEPTELRIVIGRANGSTAKGLGWQCDQPDFIVAVVRVTGEAHGNPWYYNVLDVDAETMVPVHVLVEEGKHATSTDKNADGYYTPGYDVSIRQNDAWGIRDTVRGGSLFSGKFEAWMAKVRRPEHRILPPLPVDSPLNARLADLGENPSENAVYALRPYPASSKASSDALLEHKMKEKETRDWPKIEKTADPFTPIRDVAEEGRQLRPYSVALRADHQPGLAVAFPLLLVKNVQFSLSGGYLVNRMYFKDENFRDWAWGVMYTPSASRWIDEYLSAGIETDRSDKKEDGSQPATRSFALETGLKFRFRAPGWPMRAITSFWGFRAGVKSLGALDIDHLSYIFEIGAGAW